jgi:hypothetical protein
MMLDDRVILSSPLPVFPDGGGLRLFGAGLRRGHQSTNSRIHQIMRTGLARL